MSWEDEALCAQTDPEEFFPDKGGSILGAVKVCMSCDVRKECLNAALLRPERYGVWGGVSEQGRLRLRARREAAA